MFYLKLQPPPPPPSMPPITIHSPVESSSNKTSPSSGSNLPVISDDRSALMESIRKGTKLRVFAHISLKII